MQNTIANQEIEPLMLIYRFLQENDIEAHYHDIGTEPYLKISGGPVVIGVCGETCVVSSYSLRYDCNLNKPTALLDIMDAVKRFCTTI